MRPAMWPAQIRSAGAGAAAGAGTAAGAGRGFWGRAGRGDGAAARCVAGPGGGAGLWRARGVAGGGAPPAGVPAGVPAEVPAEVPAGNGAVSSNGAAARRASPAAAVTAPGSSVLTTTTGADRNSCWATPTVSSSGGVLVSTTAAEDGSRVRAASESWDEPGPEGADEAVAGRVAEHAVTPKVAMDRAARIIPLRRRPRSAGRPRVCGTAAATASLGNQAASVRHDGSSVRCPVMTIPRERPSQVLCRPTRYRRAGGLTRTDTRLWPGRYGSAGHKLPDLFAPGSRAAPAAFRFDPEAAQPSPPSASLRVRPRGAPGPTPPRGQAAGSAPCRRRPAPGGSAVP